MTTTIWLSLAVIALFAAAAHLAIWSRKDTWARPAAVALLLLGIPAIAAAGIQSLGQHRPLTLAWELAAGDYRVLAAKMVQDEAIYLYLDTPERSAPWPLRLPWDNEMANRIAKLQDEAQGDAKGQFMMTYEPSLNTYGQQFHPLPQPPVLPPKPEQELAPHLQQDA